MRIGISGHQRLSDGDGWEWVASAMEGVLVRSPKPLIGVTSLAIGADQLFAELVLRHDGTLEAIIPSQDYARTFTVDRDRENYYHLLKRASRVEILRGVGSDEEAFLAAGMGVVDASDFLIAVWNGQPAAGLGGTADIIAYALEKRKRVVHINPVSCTVVELA